MPVYGGYGAPYGGYDAPPVYAGGYEAHPPHGPGGYDAPAPAHEPNIVCRDVYETVCNTTSQVCVVFTHT